MFNIGPWELGLILLVALIVVGPGKLPEVAKSIGQGINEFKKVTNGYKKEFQEAMDSVEPKAKPDSKQVLVAEGDTLADMADKFDAVVVDQQAPEAHVDAVAEPSKPE